MNILVTGAAGFIGSHVAKTLRERGDRVVGIDNMDTSSGFEIKVMRLKNMGLDVRRFMEQGVAADRFGGITLIKEDIVNGPGIEKIISEKAPFDAVCHLAALAGVRSSVEHPASHASVNVCGTVNVIEASRKTGCKGVVFASSSSVYGLNSVKPFSERHQASHPLSPYSASKRSCELFAHAFSHIHSFPVIGLRFFTAFGPWGRPDGAFFKFSDALFSRTPMEIFGYGDSGRSFSYIDDTVECIIKSLDIISAGEPLPGDGREIGIDGNTPPWISTAPFRIFNVGGKEKITSFQLFKRLEGLYSLEGNKTLVESRPGEVFEVYCDGDNTSRVLGWEPKVGLDEGIRRFAAWYRDDYRPLAGSLVSPWAGDGR